MKKFTSGLLALALVAVMLGLGVGAAVVNRGRVSPAAATASDELVAMLPASDVIAVVDVSRVFGEIIPQIKALTDDGGAKMAKELDEFVAETGIDPAKVTTAVVGFKMAESGLMKGSGAAILQGVTLDPARIEAAIKAKNGSFRTVEHKGKQIHVVTPPKKSAKAGAGGKGDEGEKKGEGVAGALGAGVNVDDEMALAQLEAGRVAVGNLDGLKALIDAKGAPATAANAKLTDLLKQTPAGLVRYAANVPASATETLTSQGELFAQLATIKTVFGSMEVGKDLSATLDTKMRTGTADEAAKLEASLQSLVGLGKMFLGGNQNPQMQAFGQILDQVKIGLQASDVSLSISIPRSLFDELAKSGKKTAAAESAPKKQ
jgi:hypothetical protein